MIANPELSKTAEPDSVWLTETVKKAAHENWINFRFATGRPIDESYSWTHSEPTGELHSIEPIRVYIRILRDYEASDCEKRKKIFTLLQYKISVEILNSINR